jgi:hypothetical protein
MLTTVVASQTVFDRAIAASRAVGEEINLPGLHANLDATLDGWLSEAWESVESALKSAFVHGKAQAKDFIESSRKKIEQLLLEAGTRSRELHALVLEKMRTFMNSFLNDSVALMPESLTVGSRTLNVTKLTCKQKINLGGKLEANLLKLCELVSEGEFEVEVEYGLDGPKSGI